jgi:hypothetical protein
MSHFPVEQALERTSLSEVACRNLKAKLQEAIREGVALLDNVQQLESDKASLESQLALLQVEFSKMVTFVYLLLFESRADSCAWAVRRLVLARTWLTQRRRRLSKYCLM